MFKDEWEQWPFVAELWNSTEKQRNWKLYLDLINPLTTNSDIWSISNKKQMFMSLFASNTFSELQLPFFFFFYVTTSNPKLIQVFRSVPKYWEKKKSPDFIQLAGDVMWSGPGLNLLLRPAETDGRLNSDFTSCCRRPASELWVRNNSQHQKRKQRPPKNLVVTTAWNYPNVPCVKHDRWSPWRQQDDPMQTPCLNLTHLQQLPKEADFFFY